MDYFPFAPKKTYLQTQKKFRFVSDIVLTEMFPSAAGTSATACNDDYRGPSPFSEIEVKNVRKYLEGIKHRLKAFWNIHAYSQMILTPWSYTKDLPKDYNEIVRIIDMQKSIWEGSS